MKTWTATATILFLLIISVAAQVPDECVGINAYNRACEKCQDSIDAGVSYPYGECCECVADPGDVPCDFARIQCSAINTYCNSFCIDPSQIVRPFSSCPECEGCGDCDNANELCGTTGECCACKSSPCCERTENQSSDYKDEGLTPVYRNASTIVGDVTDNTVEPNNLNLAGYAGAQDCKLGGLCCTWSPPTPLWNANHWGENLCYFFLPPKLDFGWLEIPDITEILEPSAIVNIGATTWSIVNPANFFYNINFIIQWTIHEAVKFIIGTTAFILEFWLWCFSIMVVVNYGADLWGRALSSSENNKITFYVMILALIVVIFEPIAGWLISSIS